MPLTPKKFYGGTLGSSVATLATIATGQYAEIKQISMTNKGSSNADVYLYLVESGETLDDTDAFLYKFVIEPNEHVEYGTWQVLSEKATIQGYASNGDVNMRISGALSK